VPPIVLEGVKFSAVPLHTVAWSCGAVFVITGTGFTVTVTSTNGPLHPLADGVMRYTTVPTLTPSVLVNGWLTVDPLPAPAPVTLLLLCTVQLNAVPPTLLGFVIDTLVVEPLQIA
jgi:hypothetical protein